MTVFNTASKKSHLDKTCFFDESVTLARYDQVRYPFLEQLTRKQMGFFWVPEEVDLIRDSKDFKGLNPTEQHIFSSNLKRQILLDSVQGRAPVQAFLPIISLPELENWVIAWSFFETIHSRSYTHIIRNVYSNPSVIFDSMMDIEEIVDCAKDISKYYNDLEQLTVQVQSIGYDNMANPARARYEHKKKLWLCLNAVNALEGIRFYVSFACSWAFAELKKMEGNAKIIKFIARDENLHLASTQHLIKLLPKEDPDFAKIAAECEQEVIQIFDDVVAQEKQWAEYLFKNGSIIGLNAQLLGDYVDWIANKRMSTIKLPSTYKSSSNPLPWTERWIKGSEVQVAPQETQISSYIIGGINKDVDSSTLSGMSL
jgi:ribonucleoside-diphosphate reductase beta chain